MIDPIERQAAIDALKGLPTWWADEGGYYGGAQPPMVALLDPEDAVSAIENLPSAQPEQRWISVSERLPDIKEHHCSEPCIVYCENGAYGFAELEENIFGQVGWNCERDDEYHEPLGKVLAWMSLPEPYQKEG